MKINSFFRNTVNLSIASLLLTLFLVLTNLIGNWFDYTNIISQNCSFQNTYTLDDKDHKNYLPKEVSIFPEFNNLVCIGVINNIETSNSLLIDELGNTEEVNEIKIQVLNSNTFLTFLRINLVVFSLIRLLLFSNSKSKLLKAALSIFVIEICFETFSLFGLKSNTTLLLSFNILFFYFLINKKIINFNNKENTDFKRISFREDINVLRGIAVLLVLFYHLDLPYFVNGFLGVDIFFVISGFLISSQILNLMSNNKFLVKDFYARRLKRLLPSLTSVSVLIILIFYNSVYPFIYETYLRGLFWNSIYLVNVYLNNYLNYFTQDAFYNPFLHLWSISVEEQFYILYPIVFFLYLKKRFNYQFMLVLVYFLSLSYFFITENYYLIFSRFWQFILGYFGYLIFINRKIEIKNKLVHTLIWFVATSALLFFNKTLLNLVEITFLISILSLFFLVIDNHYSTLYSKYLKVVGLVGTISYSIYLFHQPIIVWFNLKHHQNINILFTVFIIFLVSFVNYSIIEKPFRYKDSSNKQIFTISIFNILIVITTVLILPSTSIFRKIESSNYQKDRLHYENVLTAFNDIDNRKADGLCHFNNFDFNEEFYKKFKDCRLENEKAIYVLGDSHSQHIYRMLTYEYNFVVRVGSYGCRILDSVPDRCKFEEFKTFYNKEKNKNDLILYNQSGFYFFNESRDDLRLLKTKSGSYKVNLDQAKNIKEYLNSFNKEKVAVIGPWIEPGINPLNYSYESINSTKLATDPLLIKIFSIIDRRFKEEIEEDKFYYISTINFYLEDKENYIYDYSKNAFNFYDSDHLTQFGEEKFISILTNKLESKFLQLQDN